MDEKLSLIRTEDRGDMNAAVAARDHHRARMLAAFGKAAIPGLVVLIGRGLPALKPLDQIGGKGASLKHNVSLLLRSVRLLRQRLWKIRAFIAVQRNLFFSGTKDAVGGVS